MQHSIEVRHNQSQFTRLEDNISQNNPLWFLDAFVEHNALKAVGLKVQTIKESSPTSQYQSLSQNLRLLSFKLPSKLEKTPKNDQHFTAK